MEIFHAVILAIVQGITEFLPVSSSAHLIIVPKLLGWADQGLTFDVAVHVGTLIAVVIFLRKELIQMIPSWFIGFNGFQWNEYGRLSWWVIFATIPVGLAGLLGKSYIETYLREPYVIAATTIIFGVLLGLADKDSDKANRSLTMMTLSHALIFIGIAQALALIPGTSRSGATMTAALFLGYQRDAAAKFAFLLAVPTIALSGLLLGKEALENSASLDWLVLTIGIIVSAIFALLCMQWFMRFIQKVGVMPFVYYRFALAAVILIVFYSGLF